MNPPSFYFPVKKGAGVNPPPFLLPCSKRGGFEPAPFLLSVVESHEVAVANPN